MSLPPLQSNCVKLMELLLTVAAQLLCVMSVEDRSLSSFSCYLKNCQWPQIVKTQNGLRLHIAEILQKPGYMHTCDRVEFNTLNFLEFDQVKGSWIWTMLNSINLIAIYSVQHQHCVCSACSIQSWTVEHNTVSPCMFLCGDSSSNIKSAAIVVSSPSTWFHRCHMTVE